MTRTSERLRRRMLVHRFMPECILSFPRKRESSTGFVMARMSFKSALGSRFRGNDVGGRLDVTPLGAFPVGLLLATFF